MSTNPTSESYTEFQTAYDYFNKMLFSKTLPNCLITFQRVKKLMDIIPANVGRIKKTTLLQMK